MKKLFASIIASMTLVSPVIAQPEVRPFTLAAQGCMKLLECTEDVEKVENLADIVAYYQDDRADFSQVGDEAGEILSGLKASGVEVYMADGRYFPLNTRGVYYTDDNRMFLNAAAVVKPHVLINLLRHEGWHAAQDCMAGGIDNTFIAVIHLPSTVPQMWQNMAERLYPPQVVPWEAEAKWMGATEQETANALAVCAAGPMWETYEPTPMTGEWLRDNGHM
jgi:hypothetical protein